MTRHPMYRAALMALCLFGPLGRAQGQAAAIDTMAIAKLVGAAVGKDAKYSGPYTVDTTGTGARFTVAAIEASGLPVVLSSSASLPECRFHPRKEEPGSPLLFNLVFDSVTTKRTVAWAETECYQGARGLYSLRMRYVLRWHNGHWRLLPGRRVMVT